MHAAKNAVEHGPFSVTLRCGRAEGFRLKSEVFVCLFVSKPRPPDGQKPLAVHFAGHTCCKSIVRKEIHRAL